jgi:hypothetical protein
MKIYNPMGFGGLKCFSFLLSLISGSMAAEWNICFDNVMTFNCALGYGGTSAD